MKRLIFSLMICLSVIVCRSQVITIVSDTVISKDSIATQHLCHAVIIINLNENAVALHGCQGRDIFIVIQKFYYDPSGQLNLIVNMPGYKVFQWDEKTKGFYMISNDPLIYPHYCYIPTSVSKK